MTKREVGILACRILAVYAWIHGLELVPYIVGLAAPMSSRIPWPQEEVYAQLVLALHPLLLIGAGAFLWRYSGIISAWIFGHDLHDHQFEPEVSPKRIKAVDLHVIAFSSLGLWVLLDMIPRGISYMTQIVYTRTLADWREGSAIFIASASAELVLRFLFGMWLLFGARGFVYLLRRARSFGIEYK